MKIFSYFFLLLLIGDLNALRWKVGENGTWNDLDSYAFAGNKIEMPQPFIAEILPIREIFRNGKYSLGECGDPNPNLNVNKYPF